MAVLNVLLLVVGIALIALGYLRARGPWRRFQALKAQDANMARYDAWRGGVRHGESGATSASVAMAMLRRQAQIGGAILAAGFVLVLIAFLIR